MHRASHGHNLPVSTPTSAGRLLPLAAMIAVGLGCEALAPVDSTVPGNDPDKGGDTAGLDSADTDSGLIGTSGASGSGSNSPPRANAGTDKVDVKPGSFVQVDGSGTDLDDDPLTYKWTIQQMPTGSNALLENDDFEQVTVYVDLPGDYTVQLTVNDGQATHADAMKITVINDNLPPIADAGFDQTACIGDTVTLDGGASSDPDGDDIIWLWNMRRVPSGSAAQLFGTSVPSTADRPYFIPDASGLYSIELKVEDDAGLQSPADTVGITSRDCSQGSTSSSTSSSSSSCLSCAADLATDSASASAARFRTGGLAASWGLLALPMFILLYNRKR